MASSDMVYWILLGAVVGSIGFVFVVGKATQRWPNELPCPRSLKLVSEMLFPLKMWNYNPIARLIMAL